MTKDQIVNLVKTRLTQPRLQTFLNTLDNNGFFETELDEDLVKIKCLTSPDVEDDKDDFALALADLLGSDA